MAESVTLRRSLTLPLLTLYGLGTILGAGIYVLVGQVAALAGMAAPLAFIVAFVLAALSAFSYAELGSRYPVSAGEAVYTQQAFGRVWLSRLVGLLLVMVGIVSAATLANGFVGYLHVFLAVPGWLAVALLVLALSAFAMWGIAQSAWLAVVTTVIEMGGLALVVWASHRNLSDLSHRWWEIIPSGGFEVWVGIAGGAFVAFYAFIGFEDIVNVAEEVKNPTRNLALAVLLSLTIAAVLYTMVSVAAVLVVDPMILAASEAPLALVYQQGTGQPPYFIGLIGLAAVINGALIQIIMASRVLYGMGRQGWLPGWISVVAPRTRTPLRATALVAATILLLAVMLPVITLAEITSLITLTVFTVVNLSLWVIKRRDPHPAGIRVFPSWLSLAGALASIGFILLRLSRVITG